MSFYQNFWTQIKSGLDGSSTLKSYFKTRLYGYREVDIKKFPALLFDFSPPAIVESWFALNKKKNSQIKVQANMKVKDSDPEKLILKAFKAVEVLLNALDSDVSYGKKLLKISEISTPIFEVLSPAGDIRDIVVDITFETQWFTFGTR